MAHTGTWNASYETSPADADDLSEGAGKIRDLKLDVRERIAKDHYMDVAGTNDDHGEHSKVTLRVGSAPTHAANKGMLYAKDVSSKAELFYIDEDGNETQLTSGGAVMGSVNNIQSGVKTLTSAKLTDTVTITSVDTDKAFVVPSGSSNAGATDGGAAHCTITLTNATTLTFTREKAGHDTDFGWQVVEYV